MKGRSLDVRDRRIYVIELLSQIVVATPDARRSGGA